MLDNRGRGLVPGEVGLLEVLVERGAHVHPHDRVALGGFGQPDGFDYDGFEHGIEVGDKLGDRRGLGAHLLGLGEVGLNRGGLDDSCLSGHVSPPSRGG